MVLGSLGSDEVVSEIGASLPRYGWGLEVLQQVQCLFVCVVCGHQFLYGIFVGPSHDGGEVSDPWVIVDGQDRTLGVGPLLGGFGLVGRAVRCCLYGGVSLPVMVSFGRSVFPFEKTCRVPPSDEGFSYFSALFCFVHLQGAVPENS